jgi:spore maturation protein CgeB
MPHSVGVTPRLPRICGPVNLEDRTYVAEGHPQQVNAGMKLVVFGLSVSSSWGNGHATLWRGLIGALARAGHTVVFFERDVPYYAQHRDLDRLPGGALVLYQAWEDVRMSARRHLADADAAVVTSYCADAIAAAAEALDSPVPVRVFYDLDTPVTLARLGAGEHVPYIGPGGLADFDLVLSYTGGSALTALAQRLGAVRTAPLYGSVDPAVHRPVTPLDHYRADLSYLGTYAEDRQPSLARLFVEPARRLGDRRFLIGGAQYPAEFPWAHNIAFVRHLPPAEHPAFFSSSRLTLNVTRAPMAELGYCPSGRLFEAAACGTPLLTDGWAGLEQFFAPGHEILVATEPEAVVAAMAASDAELSRMARAARDRVLAEHTAARRAGELVMLLESALTSRV